MPFTTRLPLLLLNFLLFSWLAHAQYWMQNIPRQGKVAFQPDPTYPVFRNVKDYGAFGQSLCLGLPNFS